MTCPESPRNGPQLPTSYWTLAEGGQTVTFVDTEEALEACRAVAEAAACCALDAEWPPEQTGKGAPTATLLQLALWSPQHGMHLVMLDMLVLPAPAVKRWLQPLLRNKHTLKVGYSMVMDLRAVAAALGGEGGSCVAVVEPALDLATLHRFLLKHRAPGLRKAASAGLSGIVEAQLGLPLDKRQQCSAWGERPLSPEQLGYAAADAACLLALLDNFIKQAPPEELPLEAQGGEGRLRQQQQRAGPVAGCYSSSANGGSSSTSREGHGEAACSRSCGTDGELAAAEPAICRGGGGGGGAGAWMACGEAGLAAAVEAWGSRLEVSGGRAVKQRMSRRAKARARQEEEEGPLSEGFPAHVPWMDPGRRLTGCPRFICDVMAEGLARQLRLVGFDAESVPARDKTQRHAIYRCLVERAEQEGRVVLTRDHTFIAAGYTYQAYLVRADTKQAQLKEVMRVFGLTVEEGDLLSRCAKCNGEFIPEPLRPEALGGLPNNRGAEVPEGIRAQHSEFWVCADCSAVYWKGNQYGHAIARLTGMLESMTVQ